MRLLVVEDEPELAELLRRALEPAGFAVDLAGGLAEAEEHLAVARYEALILDLGLGDGDGLSLLRRLRRQGAMLPVLILTARDGPEDRVTGLDAGADDYLVKPFHMPELISRMRALLRRPNAALGVRLQLANLVLDSASRETQVDGVRIGLSVRETALLELLLRRHGRVVTREAIEQSLYSFDSLLGSNAVEVLVHRLRRKLQNAAARLQIHTVRGAGDDPGSGSRAGLAGEPADRDLRALPARRRAHRGRRPRPCARRRDRGRPSGLGPGGRP